MFVKKAIRKKLLYLNAAINLVVRPHKFFSFKVVCVRFFMLILYPNKMSGFATLWKSILVSLFCTQNDVLMIIEEPLGKGKVFF